MIETRRQDDFSPVKNAEGVDSPKTSREDQMRQWARWFKAASAPLETDASGLPRVKIEVSPLFADDERAFVEAWRKLATKSAVADGLYLGPTE